MPVSMASTTSTSQTSGFMFGTMGSTSGTRSDITSPTSGFSFGSAPSGDKTAGGAMQTPSTVVAGFSFPSNSTAHGSQANSVNVDSASAHSVRGIPTIVPVANQQLVVPPVAVDTRAIVEVSVKPQAGSSISSTKPATKTEGPAFGQGSTAVDGACLNKLLHRWMSHQLATSSSSGLEVGLWDYVAHAAAIRDRVELSTASTLSSTGTNLRQQNLLSAPEVAPDAALSGASIPEVAAPVPPATAPAAPPTPMAAQPPASASAPAFSFSSPSTLPAAASSAPVKFSFAEPLGSSASASSASTAPPFAAPPALASIGGFNFNSNTNTLGSSRSGPAAQKLFTGEL